MGWAMPGNSPLKRWKQDTHAGGNTDPFIVSWPRLTRVRQCAVTRNTNHFAIRSSRQGCRKVQVVRQLRWLGTVKVHAFLIPRDLIRELSVVGFTPSSAAAPLAP